MARYSEYKAKRTFYRGTWYDSALEAKVAEALDDHGVVYEYHRQAFRDKGFPYGQYTPDFHLPDYHRSEGWDGITNMYVEVAGIFDGRHRGNVERLATILPPCDRVCVICGDGSCLMYAKNYDGTFSPERDWPPVLAEVAREAGGSYGAR